MADDARRSEIRPRLGRGLAALLSGVQDDSKPIASQREPRKAPIEHLRPNPGNPRKQFVDTELDDLAASIKEHGVIQPVLVRAIPQIADGYEIVAGERRWRAAQRAGQHDIPIIVMDASDREALEITIIENVQRSDLNALEEAGGYARLAADYGYSHTDIARIVGKSRSYVANTLRLIQLPEHTRKLLSTGHISAGHARALLAVAHPDVVADRILADGLTVRDVERLGENARKLRCGKGEQGKIGPDTAALQNKLGLMLGARVTIRTRGESGEIRISFGSFDQLDDFCHRLCQPLPT